MDNLTQESTGGRYDEDELLIEAGRLQALAAFPEAVHEYTSGLSRFREAPCLINKLISYESRFRVTGYLLYLHADRELYGAAGGATYKNLHELCTRRQEVSPRALKTTLAMLKLTGFVETVRNGADRRSRPYRPTARMFDFVNQWLNYAVGSLDVLQPQMQRAAMLRNDPSFVERFLVSGGRDHASAKPPADYMPDFISFFGSREGAAAVILAVMQASFDSAPVPSRANIAKRFGLSKTQVSSVANEGAKLGFFSLDDAAQISPARYLTESFHRWISIELAFYARHMIPADHENGI